MPIYVQVTDDCLKDAGRHGQGSLVSNLRTQVEATQSLTGFSFFLPTSFIKKSLGRSFRLIGYRATVDEDEVILFLRVLARGSNEYEYFLGNWDKNTDSVTSKFMPYSDANIRTIHNALTALPPPPPVPVPNDEERSWLYEVFRKDTNTDELLILETDAWVKKMRASATRDFLALYHQAIEELDLRSLPAATSNVDCSIFWKKNKRVGFAYLYRPDLNRLVLLEPLRQADDVDAIIKHHQARLTRVGNSVHELSRVAGRSYPYLMVLDQDAWLAIQKDEEANLALSPEEAELLESIRRTGAEGELNYPLFINGRAGSGKSTMLQYLAADYLDFALRRDTGLLPIYMTCSRDLLERARETVRGLLTTHHERLLDGTHDPERIDRVIRSSFVVFHEFVYSLLPIQPRNELARERYVNYAEFRRLWSRDFARRPEARRMTPDVAWHTIRSYIKGVRSTQADELGPEEFEALPRKRRSVSPETYRQVYDRVWNSWYKRLCDEDGYWDDQDLASRALDLDCARATNLAAVFCDEAQDFTSVELELIFQLSVYSKRSLQPEELRRVPLVFAGDPLQTINPTGFRWDAVQAEFHDRFFAVLDPRRRSRLNMSYKELRFNYRSNPGIVRFCNLIQLVRAALLGSGEVMPQEAWWVEEPSQTVWFAVDNAPTKQQLQQRPELVKLVNCEEGEESEYARADSILKDLMEESDGVYRNVLGPTRAKGLEFPAVVLYRFAETAPRDFHRLLAGEIDVRSDLEQQLPYEYFFNRLYVAASRAKSQLVVVDSENALDGFWRFATDPELADRLMQQVETPYVWKDAINFLVRGREEAWSGERIDPREQGLEFAMQGRRKRDAYLLRQASLAYRSAGDEIEAGRCLALAAEFEGKLQDAGDRYRDLRLLDDAFRCYWGGQLFRRLCDLAAKEVSVASRLECRAADFVERGTGVQTAFLSEIAKAAKDPAWRQDVVKDQTWKHVLIKLAERLVKVLGDKSLPWAVALDAFRQLSNDGVPVPDQHIAVLAFGAGEYAAATDLWERSGSTDREEYRRAKALLEPFPQNIIWFSRLRDHKQVLSQWREHRLSLSALGDLDETVVHGVVDAALDGGDLQLAADLLAIRPDREHLAALLGAVVRKSETTVALESALTAARFLVASRSWTSAIRAAEDTDFSEFLKTGADDLKKILLRKADGAASIFRAVVEEMAESLELASESAERQGPVAEFLQRHFVGKTASVGRQHGISPEVLGAAIERAGKIVDALQFYETLGNDTASSKELKLFAAERLARNLERHAVWLRAKGDETQAREKETRAKRAREAAGFANRQIPEYPTLRRKPASAAPSEWNRGVFKMVLSRAHGRLLIEHTERFERVSVDATGKELRGDAAFTILSKTDDAIVSWRIPGWEMTIKLVNIDNGLTVVALFGGDRLDVRLT